MKLGLIIKSTSAGEQEVFSINKEVEWAKFAADSRSIIKDLEGFDGSGKSVIIAKILGTLGYLIGVVKARPEGSGRPNDNTTAWIHVPAKMQISGEELCTVITDVEKQLSASMGINPAILNELFSKKYAEKDVQFTALAFIGYNLEGRIGWRKYGSGTDFVLNELLGDSIAQSYYKKYKCICFTDSSLGFSMVGGEPITQDIERVAKIKVPIDNKGFKPFIKNTGCDIPFDKDIEIPAKLPLRVIWKKEGYSDIEKDNPNNLDIQGNERKLILKRSWIKIRNRKYKYLDDAEIHINNKLFTSDTMEITDAAIRDGIKIQVSHSGYEPKEVIKQISPNIEIELDDKQCSKEYILRIEDGKNLDSDAHIIVKMDNHYTGMPLKGYRSEDGCIVYENNIMLKIKWFAIGVVSFFVFGLLWTGYEAFDNWTDNHKFQWGWPPIVTEKTVGVDQPSETAGRDNPSEVPQKTDAEKACEYLSSSNIWHKDSLAKYDCTKNLFDDMNTFQLNNLVMLENSELNEVELIKNLVAASKQSIEKRIKPNIGKEDNSGKYNSTTDFGINVDNYISWITKQHQKQASKGTAATSKPSTKNAGAKKSDSVKNGQSESVENKKTDKIRGGI